MYGADGRKVLDAYNNVAHVGHCHPYVVEALHRQASTLNTNTRYLFEPVLDYAERLIGTIGPDHRCMFTCTGSEANDLAWRLATTFTGNKGAITTENGYHGNTSFLDSIDGSSTKTSIREADWWVRVPGPKGEDTGNENAHEYAAHYNAAVARLGERGHRAAAFFIEPFFCTEGVLLPSPGYINEAVAKVRQSGGLVVADEVQAGLSRSGSHVWAYQRLGIDPDIVVMGKPMGNGHPIGVVVARQEIIDKFYRVDRYFNTFGGNPVSCAVGIAVLEVVEREKLQANAKIVGARIAHAIKDLAKQFPVLGQVRGQGLLLGVEIVDPQTRAPAGKQAGWIINEMCRRGVLVGTTGANRKERSILKIRPPMVFDSTGVETLISALEDTLTALAKKKT
jgi:4-aminobutyrate aminotransferase-like enzyme